MAAPGVIIVTRQRIGDRQQGGSFESLACRVMVDLGWDKGSHGSVGIVSWSSPTIVVSGTMEIKRDGGMTFYGHIFQRLIFLIQKIRKQS